MEGNNETLCYGVDLKDIQERKILMLWRGKCSLDKPIDTLPINDARIGDENINFW